jgi:hypothetical protein
MKKYALMLAGLAVFLGKPVFAEEMKMDKAEMKHSAAMCEKHCNLMELQKQVDLLKSQAATSGKVATKEHLKKDIEAYEEKLKAMEADLDAMK